VAEVHACLLVQQVASVVPTLPYLAESLNLLALQLTEAPRQYCSSSTQHVVSSFATHVVPAQNKVPALHLCFLPSVGHFHVEHLFLFEQHVAIPMLPAVVLSLAESLYLGATAGVGQVTVEYLHLVESCSQHVVRSAVVHAPDAHSKSAALAFSLSPDAHPTPPPPVIVEHFALLLQQADLGSAGVSLFFAVSLNRLLPHVTAVLTHWLLSFSQ